MKRQIVRPKSGCTVVDPYGRQVPADGAIVIWSSYWDRRVRDGVITVHEVEKEAPVKAATPSKPRKKSTKTTEGTDK